MRSVIQDHYGLEGGRFNHKILEGVQDSLYSGRALVRASVGSTKNALYFVLEYNEYAYADAKHGAVRSVHLTLEEAQQSLKRL